MDNIVLKKGQFTLCSYCCLINNEKDIHYK